MSDAVQVEIDVQVRPLKVIRTDPLHVENLLHPGVLEPWIFFVIQEIFLTVDQNPYPEGRDMADLSR
jgi:hypothetical protein